MKPLKALNNIAASVTPEYSYVRCDAIPNNKLNTFLIIEIVQAANT